MYLKLLLPLVCALSFLSDAAQAQVFWRVSIKVFTDGSNRRPVNRTDAAIQDDYAYYNKLLGIYARGCRFQVTEIVQLPATLSGWYNLDPRNSGNRNNLQNNATSNTVLYAYRDNAINVYINNGFSGVCCGSGNGLIFVGREDNHITPLHEIGHMLGLPHTQGAGCNSCCPDPLGCCDTPGNDGFADTPLDLPCWNSQDLIAQNNFGNTYANLNAGQQYLVDNAWLNSMSYHYGGFNNCLERLTPDQLDLVADISNGPRNNVASGRIVWVDRNNTCASPNDLAEPFRSLANALTDIPAGARQCRTYVLTPGSPVSPLTVSLGGPHKTFTVGVNGARAGDVLLIRAGSYNEPQTINKNVTLAATRGNAVIGR